MRGGGVGVLTNIGLEARDSQAVHECDVVGGGGAGVLGMVGFGAGVVSSDVVRMSTEQGPGDGRGQDGRGEVRRLNWSVCPGQRFNFFVFDDSLGEHISPLRLFDGFEVGWTVERK